jgi:hypothetical protein
MQNDSFRKDTVIKKGPPKRLSGPEIVENFSKLVLDRESDVYKGCGEEYNWTHICALWEHPYAQTLLLMDSIDVMHQEHNVAESIVRMCLDITSKTKDNFKPRRDVANICNRPSLELNERGGK